MKTRESARAKIVYACAKFAHSKTRFQNFLVQKEATQGWGLELLKFESRDGSENRSKLIN